MEWVHMHHIRKLADAQQLVAFQTIFHAAFWLFLSDLGCGSKDRQQYELIQLRDFLANFLHAALTLPFQRVFCSLFQPSHYTEWALLMHNSPLYMKVIKFFVDKFSPAVCSNPLHVASNLLLDFSHSNLEVS
ncbi:Pentatricopeptide repeat-containing protein [Trichinella spiralis]|uniref:Pentatricopeptide repeat-containing protein n=1 Tax=Trichinella spiralis TaxID=6334 RepID=A0ABR3KCZ0_TRISP